VVHRNDLVIAPTPGADRPDDVGAED
jgi:hypothetical protein